MFDLVHAMRTRVITSKAFTFERILGAILFKRTELCAGSELRQSDRI